MQDKQRLLLPALFLQLAACGAVNQMADDAPGDDAPDAPDAATTPDPEPDADTSCAADSECPSGACDLAAGECYDATEIVLIAPDGVVTGTCGDSIQPCGSIDHAASQMSPTRKRARMLYGSYGPQILTSKAMAYTVDAREATIRAETEGAVGVFTNGALDVTIVGLEVVIAQPTLNGSAVRGLDVNIGAAVTLREVMIRSTNAACSTCIGIEINGVVDAEQIDVQISNGFGIALSGPGTQARLALRRSRIHDSRYGVMVGSPNYQITNNVFSHNLMQAVWIDTASGPGAKQIELNTFLANGSQVASGGTELVVVRSGLEGTTTLKLAPRGNLFSNGRPYSWNAATGTGLHLVHGQVLPRLSLLDMPNQPPAVDGNVYAPALLTADGHLTATSPAIDAIADLGTSPPALDDLDGDPRPSGAGFDIGADERAP